MAKQSSSRLSTKAARYAKMPNAEMWKLVSEYSYGINSFPSADRFFADVRSLAASVLAQDETKGQGGKAKGPQAPAR